MEEAFIKECSIGITLILRANIRCLSFYAPIIDIQALFMLVIRYLVTVHKENEVSSRNTRQRIKAILGIRGLRSLTVL